MSTKTCTKAFGTLDEEKTCHGTLLYTHQEQEPAYGNFEFRCDLGNAFTYSGDDHDCICFFKQNVDIQACQGKGNSILADCSSDSNECSITWKEQRQDNVPSYCTKIWMKNQCTVKCRTNDNDKVFCRNTIQCASSSGNTEKCFRTVTTTTQSSSFTRDDVSSTSPTTSTKTTTYVTVPSTKSTTVLPGTSTQTTNIVPINKARQTAPQGNEDTVVIALGVVAGLAILALIVTLILVFVFRRRKRGRKAPTTNVYMDMNASDVGSTTYETSMGNKKHRERLENKGPNVRDHQSGVYMDIDDPAIVTLDQTIQQQSGTGTTDSIYNSIDDYGPNSDVGYAEANDLPQPSQDLSCPVDKPVTSANYFVVEKQEEMSGGSSERLT